MKMKRKEQGKTRGRSQSRVKDLPVENGARTVKAGATAQLAKACATGTHFPDVKLTV
jgi:hypothetical protein